MSHRHGNFVWFELMTHDVDRARAFYSELIGWSINAIDLAGQPYNMVNQGENDVGGIVALPAEKKDVPAHWMAHLSVADVDDKVGAFKKAGGKVLFGPMDITGVGRVAGVADPHGAVLGLFKSAEGDPERRDSAHGAWHWTEMWSQDAKASLEFYKTTFGLSHGEMDMGPMGTYYILKVDEDNPAAGLMQSPAKEIPPNWLPYIHVEKIDEVVARATSLGAEVKKDADDIPGVGRIAIIADPTGGMVGLITPAAQA